MKDHIGESIRKARIIKNISQQELALALNVERSTVSGWETGKRIPNVEMLGRLCAILDIPMSSIMADSRQSTAKQQTKHCEAPRHDRGRRKGDSEI